MHLLFLFCLFRRSGSSNPDFPTYWWAFFRLAAFRMNTALFPFRHLSQVCRFIATRFSSVQFKSALRSFSSRRRRWPLTPAGFALGLDSSRSVAFGLQQVCVWCVGKDTVHSEAGGLQQEREFAESTELPACSYTGNSERWSEPGTKINK